MSFITLLISPAARLVLGVVLGYVFLLFDQYWLRRYYQEHPTTIAITQTPLFMALYFPLSFFVLTSSGSWIGSGMILGIGGSWLQQLARFHFDPRLIRQFFLTSDDTSERWQLHEVKQAMWVLSGWIIFWWVVSIWNMIQIL